MKKILNDDENWYPDKQLNSTQIIEPISALDLLICKIKDYQQIVYNFGVKTLKKKYPILKNKESKGIQYVVLGPLIQILNFSYPINEKFDKWNAQLFKNMYGKKGLQNCLYDRSVEIGRSSIGKMKKRELEYKSSTLETYGRIFSPEQLPKYSSKMSYICKTIKKSKGIVLIYSQFIDGGCVPLALALEEMGFKRYGQNKSLLKNCEAEPLNAYTMDYKKDGEDFSQAKYIMITGDKILSPDNNLELTACTNENNKNGEIVKVVIVSKAGSEGLDFKNIRQVHILEPWYNLNRIEQTIGRGVRNLSHCLLPFSQRNVEIYLYGSELEDNTHESVDLYMYRLAEKKAKKIGIVSRILKENAVDCNLNKAYNLIDTDKSVNLITSSNQNITFSLKDKPNTSLCDFMDNCDCNCIPEFDADETEIKSDTYDETFIMMNIDKILYRIKMLFKETYVYSKTELITSINAQKFYPKEQIYIAINQLLEDENEFITDTLGRIGRLIVIGDFYMFQPLEVENKNISMYERKVPLDYKRKHLEFTLPENIPESETVEELSKKIKTMAYDTPEEKTETIKKPETNAYDTYYKQIEKDYNIIIQENPEKIDSKTRNIWTYNCSWVIKNLKTYNPEYDANKLIKLSVYHLIDKLEYKIKLILANHLYFNTMNESNNLEKYMKSYFDSFLIDNEVLCLYDEKNSKKPYKFLFKENNNWIENTMKVTKEINNKWIQKFTHKLKEDDTKSNGKLLNTHVGFMIYNERYDIIFKTKNLKTTSIGRIRKGIRCSAGQTKDTLINIINKLLPKKATDDGNMYKKYIIDKKDGNNRKVIKYIYGKNIYDVTSKKEEKNIDIKLSTLQLCIEIELLFRYFNDEEKNGKVWFLSELESNINKIETIGI